MKNKILLIVILIIVGISALFFIQNKSEELNFNDISIINRLPVIAYENLGYYRGIKFPIVLNFEQQEERFNAQDEFFRYVVETLADNDNIDLSKYSWKNFGAASIVAYKLDLNNDGWDEIIGVVKDTNYTYERNGYKIEILIPSEIYKMQNSDVSKFDKDYLGYQRISYHIFEFDARLDGIVVMPEITNGYHDLSLYNKTESMFRRVVRAKSQYINRNGNEKELASSIYLRFNNERNKYYKYELSID